VRLEFSDCFAFETVEVSFWAFLDEIGIERETVSAMLGDTLLDVTRGTDVNDEWAIAEEIDATEFRHCQLALG
jgi:hypothetical protein